MFLPCVLFFTPFEVTFALTFFKRFNRLQITLRPLKYFTNKVGKIDAAQIREIDKLLLLDELTLFVKSTLSKAG